MQFLNFGISNLPLSIWLNRTILIRLLAMRTAIALNSQEYALVSVFKLILLGCFTCLRLSSWFNLWQFTHQTNAITTRLWTSRLSSSGGYHWSSCSAASTSTKVFRPVFTPPIERALIAAHSLGDSGSVAFVRFYLFSSWWWSFLLNLKKDKKVH